MKSRIALSTSLIKRLLSALPGVDNGRVVLDLGGFGTASLKVNQLLIGHDEVQLPLRFHPRGDPESRGLNAALRLTSWRIADGMLWFTLEQIGVLRGGLFQAAQGALLKMISGMIQRRLGDGVRLQRRDDQLGIPVTAFLEEWGNIHPSIEVAEIEVNGGIALHLR